MKRSRRIATIVALAGLLAALLAPTAGAAEPTFLGTENPETAAEKLASESTLRLTDLPAGFVVGGETSCFGPREASENEDLYEQEEHLQPNPAEAFIAATKPSFCLAEYERLYRAPGTGRTPLSLTSFALVAPSAKAAREGLALGAEPYEYSLDTGGFDAGTAPAIGEETRLFRTMRARAPNLSNLPGTLVLWRQGAVIAGVFAIAAKATVSDAAAATYAARQQTYVATPRPFLATEAADVSTYLDNPNLKVPVWWLGPSFNGPHGIAKTFFEGAYGSEESFQPVPGRELSVDYSNGPFLDTWTRAGWAKFSKTELGRRQWNWHCTRSKTVKLSHGHAVLYAAYKKNEPTCPSSPPRHFSAHVFLPGVVVAIGESTCLSCQSSLYGYESLRGLEAVVHALRRYRP